MSPGYEGIFYNPLKIKFCSASTSSRQCRLVFVIVWLAGFVPLNSLITNSQFTSEADCSVWLLMMQVKGDHKRKIVGRSGKSAVILKGLKSAITFSTLSCPLLHLCSPSAASLWFRTCKMVCMSPKSLHWRQNFFPPPNCQVSVVWKNIFYNIYGHSGARYWWTQS